MDRLHDAARGAAEAESGAFFAIYLAFMPRLLGWLSVNDFLGDFMQDKRQIVPVAGLLATLLAAAYMVVQLSGQTPAPSADFTHAAVADVQDAQGRVVLSGRFLVADEDDEDVERKAALAPTGLDADASGEAEVEFSRDAPVQQEVEFSVRNVSPGDSLTFVIDGTPVATVSADARGRAEIEIIVRIPGTTASR